MGLHGLEIFPWEPRLTEDRFCHAVELSRTSVTNFTARRSARSSSRPLPYNGRSLSTPFPPAASPASFTALSVSSKGSPFHSRTPESYFCGRWIAIGSSNKRAGNAALVSLVLQGRANRDYRHQQEGEVCLVEQPSPLSARPISFSERVAILFPASA